MNTHVGALSSLLAFTTLPMEVSYDRAPHPHDPRHDPCAASLRAPASHTSRRWGIGQVLRSRSL